MTPEIAAPTLVGLESSASSRAAGMHHHSTPPDDLAALIDAGERELRRMRAAAAEAAREEDRLRSERLTELLRDFEHNLSVLAERDRTIEDLGAELLRAERRRGEDLEEAERTAAARVREAEDAVRSEAEGRIREKARQLHEDMDRELLRRLNQGMRERERDIRDEVLESVSAEMDRKERTIASLQRRLEDGEAGRLSQEEALRVRLREADETNADNLRVLGEKWKAEEARLEEQVTALQRTNFDQEKRLSALTAEAEKRSHEKDQDFAWLAHHIECLENEISTCRESVSEKDGKISELLQTLLLVEESLLQQQKDWSNREEEMISDMNLKCCNIEALRDEASDTIQKLEVDCEKLKGEHDIACQQWEEKEKELLGSIQRLREQLDSERRCRKECREAAKQSASEKDAAFSALEEELEGLRTENKSQQAEIGRFKELADGEKQRMEQVLMEHNGALKRDQECYSVTISELKKSHEKEIQEIQLALNSKVDCLSQERDGAQKERRVMVSRVDELEHEIGRLQKTCSDLENELCARDQVTKGASPRASLPPRHKRAQPKTQTQGAPRDSSFDSNASFVPSAFSALSDDEMHLPDVRKLQQDPYSSRTNVKHEEELSSVRAENSRLKAMVTMMRTELEGLASADQDHAVAEEDSDGCARKQCADFPAPRCRMCLSMGTLEKQLGQCRKYLDFLLESDLLGCCKEDNEVKLLRKNFRELNNIVDGLRTENRRLSMNECFSHSQTKTDEAVTNSDGCTQQAAEVKELKEKITELQSELDEVLSERDRLLDLSNKLRASLERSVDSGKGAQEDGDGSAGRMENPPFSRSTDSPLQDCIKEQNRDFAVTSCAVSLRNGATKSHKATRATDRATVSQRQSFERLQARAESNSVPTLSKKKERKVRNWNDVNDNV